MLRGAALQQLGQMSGQGWRGHGAAVVWEVASGGLVCGLFSAKCEACLPEIAGTRWSTGLAEMLVSNGWCTSRDAGPPTSAGSPPPDDELAA